MAAADTGVPKQVVRRRVAAGRHFVDRTSDPDQALANLAECDRLFTERARAEVEALGLMSTSRDIGSWFADSAGRIRWRGQLGESDGGAM